MATSGGFRAIIQAIPVDEIQFYHKLAVDFGLLDVILHPYDYADILIRLGYEPFPAVEEPRMFSGVSLMLPGINTYVYYLYSVEGFRGIYRSVVPYVAAALIYRHLSAKLINMFPKERPPDEPRLCEEFTLGNVGHFLRIRAWKMMSSIAALHVSHPFYVIAVRTMARFVTCETTKEGRRSILGDDSWLAELLKVTTVKELYAGMVIKMFREFVFATVSAGSFLIFMKLFHLIQADVTQADPLERAIEYIGNNLGTMYASPFGNASDIMVIQGSSAGDILLGKPPFIDTYTSSFDCLSRLSTYRKWKNSGGSLFKGRPYKGLTESINGRLFPVGELFGPFYLPWYARSINDVPYYLVQHYKAWKDLGISPGGRVGALQHVLLKEYSLGGGRSIGSRRGGPPKVLKSEMAPSFLTGSFMTGPYLSSNPFRL